MASLADQPSLGEAAFLEELLKGSCDHLLAGTVDLVEPNTHFVANYIKIYLINSPKIHFLYLGPSPLQKDSWLFPKKKQTTRVSIFGNGSQISILLSTQGHFFT